ncbi:MAG TPA: cupin [Opitutus sp.]|nr:cupin [Opitutus sp.]
MAAAPQIRTFRFEPAGNFPNNPRLPVAVYPQVAGMDAKRGGPESLARLFEATWPKHGWEAEWRWGVYEFPHYHSTAHEVLGVYRGRATLRLGDSAGVTLDVAAGDLLVLPAGTAHQNLGASADFHVVGGYPKGQSADLLRGGDGERAAAEARIARVPLPDTDPFFGPRGPLATAWGF